MIGKPNKKKTLGGFKDQIDIWACEKGAAWGDGDIDTFKFSQLAEVTVLDGSKALEYKEQGHDNPVIIETNFIDFLPDFLKWEDVKIVIKSFIDPDNHLGKRVRMLGNIIK